MRKISITPDLEQMVEIEYVEAIKNSDLNQRIVYELTVLRDEFRMAGVVDVNIGSIQRPNWQVSPSSPQNYADYVGEILSGFTSGEFLRWKPAVFIRKISNMNALVDHQIIGKPIMVNGVRRKTFANLLVDAMHYDDIRKKIIPPIYRKLELKACVYCNANYTISDSDGEGYYDLDHWKPKSFYPFLCISFYNLQPSCPSCNRRKSASDIPFFGLWDDTAGCNLDVLRFKLEERSLVNYLVFLDKEDLKVELKPANAWSQLQNDIRDNTEQRMHIEARYAEHNDYTEEIVWKSKIYNASMIQSLRDSKFSALIPNQADLERFILGTYSDPDDIHKRPLTRLSIDIAKQLGLI